MYCIFHIWDNMIFLWTLQLEPKFWNNFIRAAYQFYFFQVLWGVPDSIICIQFKTNENPNRRRGDGKRQIPNLSGSSLCWREEGCDASLIAAVEEMKHWLQVRFELSTNTKEIDIILITASKKQMPPPPLSADVITGTVPV